MIGESQQANIRQNKIDPYGPSPTYASALRNSIPHTHLSAVARTNMRACQILIDKNNNMDVDPFQQLSELELVTKANLAVTFMGTNEKDSDELFIGVRKLANGGILFDMESLDSAKWIQDNKNAFIEKFSSAAVVKERAISVIVKYVPIRHSPGALSECRKIEWDSRLPPNTITSTRWVKPIQHRTQGQQTAHIIAKFSTVKATNLSIRDGLLIAGKQTWARKLKMEPRHCLKGQKLGARHMAAECKDVEICGTCGKNHRTAHCDETDPTKFKCANCNTLGHASWDHTCPKFLAACNRLEKNNSESKYKYFPDNNPWTWEQCINESC